MNKTLWVVVGISIGILIAAGAYWGYSYYRGVPQAPAPADQPSVAAQPAADSFMWGFAAAGGQTDSNAGGAETPLTKVTLTANGKFYDVGTHTGSCSTIEASEWELLPGEKSGVICWFAGAGTEIGIFEEGAKLVVKTGDLEESTAETPGLRGNFKVLLTL